jgi:hypothetical protein
MVGTSIIGTSVLSISAAVLVGGRSGTAGQDQLARRPARERVAAARRAQRSADLREDLVDLLVRHGEVAVAPFVVIDEQRQAARHDLYADVARAHRVAMREVEHPRVAGRVHRLDEQQPAEACAVRGPANCDARLVGAPRGRARREVLVNLVTEVLEVVAGRQREQRGEHRAGIFDFGGEGRERADDRAHRQVCVARLLHRCWRRRRLTALAR